MAVDGAAEIDITGGAVFKRNGSIVVTIHRDGAIHGEITLDVVFKANAVGIFAIHGDGAATVDNDIADKRCRAGGMDAVARHRISERCFNNTVRRSGAVGSLRCIDRRVVVGDRDIG
ncbi:hypothetical protein MMA231_01863 [Asticcacaulis sp. MM231]